jgi:hypothetical protein
VKALPVEKLEYSPRELRREGKDHRHQGFEDEHMVAEDHQRSRGEVKAGGEDVENEVQIRDFSVGDELGQIEKPHLIGPVEAPQAAVQEAQTRQAREV